MGGLDMLRKARAQLAGRLIVSALVAALVACLPAAASSTIATLSTRSNVVPLVKPPVIPSGISDKRCASYSDERLYADYYVDAAKSWNVLALPADAKAGVNPLCVITYNGMDQVGGL